MTRANETLAYDLSQLRSLHEESEKESTAALYDLSTRFERCEDELQVKFRTELSNMSAEPA